MGQGLRRTAFDQSSYAYWTGKYSVVNVKDYGAVGDGVHDDTAAIQAALDEGGHVVLPKGTYLTSATLTIPADTSLSGDGWDTSIISYSGLGSGIELTGDNVSIAHLQVDCTGSPTSGGAIAANDGLFGVYIHRVKTHAGYNGIQIGYNLNTVWLDHIYANGSYAGLYCQSGANDSNSVYQGGQVGVQLDSSDGAFNSSGSTSYAPLAFWTTNTKAVSNPNLGIWLLNFQFNAESGTPPTGTTAGNLFLDSWSGEVHLFGCWGTGSNYGILAYGASYGTQFLEVKGGSWSSINLNVTGNTLNLQGVVISGANIEYPGGSAGITIGSNTGWVAITGNIIKNWTVGVEWDSTSGNFFGPFHIINNQFIGVTTPVETNGVTIGGLRVSDNFGYNPVGSITPPASPLLSGTVYQNKTAVPITIYQPAYATTSGTAGSVAVALGSSGTPATLFTQWVNGSTTSTLPEVIQLRVPPGWYYSFTITGATLANAQIQGE